MAEFSRWSKIVALCLAISRLSSAALLAEEKAPGAYADADSLPEEPTAEEPLVRAFSPALAAKYYDETASAWAETRRCAACHTIPPYLMARPLLTAKGTSLAEVRGFVERIVVERLEGEPGLPPDGIAAVGLQVAVSLAINDRLTTGKLHPATRQALDRMWTRQRDDGSWEWPFRDVPPIKLDEHYGVTFAAIGAGMAPEGYADTEAAREGLAKIRRYLKAHPPTSLHQQGMLAWASGAVTDLLSAEECASIAQALLAAQRPDGGWSLAGLVENRGADAGPAAANVNVQLRELQAKPGYGTDFLAYIGRTGAYASSLTSDGYATGFVIYVARQTGVPADDPRIARGVSWLRKNQRQSGRWFTPSQGNHTHNYISNAGTGYAIMALAACGAAQ